MTVKIGINGFGRIGRLTFRRLFELKSDEVEVVAINDLTDPAMLAYLLQHDSIQGRFPAEVSSDETGIIVDGKHYTVYAERDAANIPWVANDGVELVVESTGFYTNTEKSAVHLRAGVKKVLVSAPAGDMPTVVYGVNQDVLTADDRIIFPGSCTTQSVALLAKPMNDHYGIRAGSMTTIHAYTASQSLTDGPKGKNARNNRAAAENFIPHSTGAAKAIGLVVPELDGKLKGQARRVPVRSGSLTELSLVLKKAPTAEEINAMFREVTRDNDSFGYDDTGLVSSDMIGDTHGAIFDPTLTEVINLGEGKGELVKVNAWYDNEYGFTCNMVRTLLHFVRL
ncbi:type I glyceraldehyde-3-phosphate dehydrogenase [Bifidobacterium sp. ESL0690]|uniref:type I glyceraldehyde-3-phosphate dehydrogenase n=1 Tax=Bifidobacterium sp. ESL0690 TaxID=2983214 RepID=UPI0023F9978F|nr:type I glyceraldehyde-3-phosphate dehydrogenase [Bifidobacterium sp. ESL0690]WEV46452.1 type I glyceraldehyde-3-phosphate dehydrogenase [Bifidobacterium sp. ESL0690]